MLRIKVNEKGKIIRHKARLTAKGYSQVQGVDYEETFAPVASQNSLRIVLSIAASNDWDIAQCDVETAFLIAQLDGDPIFMEQPEGYQDTTKANHVCLLHRSLYGLKQSPRLWNKTLDNAMKAIGLTPTSQDPCIYVFKHETKTTAIVYVYVTIYCSKTWLHTYVHLPTWFR